MDWFFRNWSTTFGAFIEIPNPHLRSLAIQHPTPSSKQPPMTDMAPSRKSFTRPQSPPPLILKERGKLSNRLSLQTNGPTYLMSTSLTPKILIPIGSRLRNLSPSLTANNSSKCFPPCGGIWEPANRDDLALQSRCSWKRSDNPCPDMVLKQIRTQHKLQFSPTMGRNAWTPLSPPCAQGPRTHPKAQSATDRRPTKMIQTSWNSERS